MSVGNSTDDGTISIFTKDGVTVHKEQDVLIKCKGKPILIGARDDQGRYRIPLLQQKGQWQPPTTQTQETSHSGASASQQRLQSTIHRTSHQVDACCMQIPSQINMDQSSQSWKLHLVAAPHEKEPQQVLPQNYGN